MNLLFTVARCRVTPRSQWRHRDGFAPSSPSSSACFLLRTPPQVIQRLTLVVNASNPSPRLLSTAPLGGLHTRPHYHACCPATLFHPSPPPSPEGRGRKRNTRCPSYPSPLPARPSPLSPNCSSRGPATHPHRPTHPHCVLPIPTVLPAAPSCHSRSFKRESIVFSFPHNAERGGTGNPTPTPSSLPGPPNSRLHKNTTVI